MELKAYLSELGAPAREAFAASCVTTLGHLKNVMYGIRPCSPELASALERCSDGAVKRWDMRADDWHEIWPELIGAEGAPLVVTPEPATAGQG